MGYNNHNDEAFFFSRPGLHVFRFNIAVFTKVMMQIEKKKLDLLLLIIVCIDCVCREKDA